MKQVVFRIIGILGAVCLFACISLGVWIYFRGTQPLDLPEARGITFWQLIRDRWNAWSMADKTISAQPQFKGCRNNILSLFLVNFRSSANFVYASLVPASRLAAAFHYWETQKPDAVMPKLTQVKWYQLPDVFWEYFSRAYWRGLVSVDGLAGQCQLGPVDFSAILGVEK